jgi:cold shock CspA family protein
MKGQLKNIIPQKNFGFIKANSSEIFFHRSDFNGHWEDLESDFKKVQGKKGEFIELEFDVVDSPKGPRAANVKRTDFPNQAV